MTKVIHNNSGRWYSADDIDKLVKELDIVINGADGCSPQARLCDLVAQIKLMQKNPAAWGLPHRNFMSKQQLMDVRFTQPASDHYKDVNWIPLIKVSRPYE